MTRSARYQRASQESPRPCCLPAHITVFSRTQHISTYRLAVETTCLIRPRALKNVVHPCARGGGHAGILLRSEKVLLQFMQNDFTHFTTQRAPDESSTIYHAKIKHETCCRFADRRASSAVKHRRWTLSALSHWRFVWFETLCGDDSKCEGRELHELTCCRSRQSWVLLLLLFLIENLCDSIEKIDEKLLRVLLHEVIEVLCRDHFSLRTTLFSSPFSRLSLAMNFFGAMLPTRRFCVAILWKRSAKHVSKFSFCTPECLGTCQCGVC